MQIKDYKIRVNGLYIYYRIAGTPTNLPIVFLHGWGARKDSLFGRLGVENVIVELAKYFYVVAPELPGLIRSQPPKRVLNMRNYSRLLHDLLKSLALEKFVLMGQSWGGGVAITYASLYHDQIRRLILVDAKLGKRKDDFYLKLGKFWHFVFDKSIKSQWFPFFVKKIMITIYLGTPWKSINKNVKQYAIMSEISRYADKEMKVDYTKLKKPLLLVYGDKDTSVTPIEKAKEIHRKIKNSKLIIVKGGHTVLYHRPEEVVGEIVRNL